MKKLLCTLSVLLSFNVLADTGRADIATNRGLELMREANFNQITELSKESGSLQSIEYFVGNNKEVKSRGFLLGTVSNFVDAPNIHAGLTVSYQKYKFKDSDTKDREYSLDTFLSYRKDNYLFIGGLGYTQSKKVNKRAYSGNFEVGKFSSNQTLNLFDKGRFYYYAGIDSNKWKHKNMENIRFNNFRLGVSSYHFIDRFRFVGNLEFNADDKKYDINREKFNLAYSLAVGYNIYDDLLIELKYKGTKNKNFYDNLISLGFTHTF